MGWRIQWQGRRRSARPRTGLRSLVRIEPGHYGLVWQRCVPTEAQRLARLAEAEFTSRQLDAFEYQYGVWDPDGGLADGETLEASWDGEAWDDPDA